jgi:hypothetical protein
MPMKEEDGTDGPLGDGGSVGENKHNCPVCGQGKLVMPARNFRFVVPLAEPPLGSSIQGIYLQARTCTNLDCLAVFFFMDRRATGEPYLRALSLGEGTP